MAGSRTRELHPLTPDRISDLVGPCAPCTFWQTVPHNGHGDPVEPLEVLAEWADTVSTEWGPPGQVAYAEGRPAGHVIVAPARYVARLAAFPTAPSDPSTLVLVTAMTTDAAGGAGLRKALVRAAAKEALQHGSRSLDAVAARPLAPGRHECVLEAAFLEEVGFRVQRDHPAYPRLRLDLRRALTFGDEVTEALRRVLAKVHAVRPVPETHPNSSSHARSAEHH